MFAKLQAIRSRTVLAVGAAVLAGAAGATVATAGGGAAPTTLEAASAAATASTSTTAAPADGLPGERRTFAAADAGTVTYAVDGRTLALVAVEPAAGWGVVVEEEGGDEVEVDLRSGARRVQVEVEWEDGRVRERVRTREADGTRTEAVDGGWDDHGGDGDRDEPGDDRDDRDDDR